ncbi:hairy-related 5 [Conger conger]|uniref:hairy-related 5 n=1 Tax=Conger conger TaxID=82655 RepID=UPI002A5A3E3F|nr:hairy-related 5 [Conger conger]
MKTLTAELPDQKDVRRVPKPQMEKRRRDRINNSLETLRLLLLENTHNEKLRNPKVEKAEILESVVDFLKAEHEGGHEPWPEIRRRREKPGVEDDEVKSPSKHHHSYHAGMRTCLLRVGHFISAKSHELEDSSEEGPQAKSPLHQDPTCRRVEKAEILEHTVLFLRNTENPVPHEEAEQHPFRHGFLACLKQATQFLKVEGEGQRAGGALTDALSLHRLRPSTHDAATRLSPRPPRTQSEGSPVQAWQQGWKSRQQLCAALGSWNFPYQRAPLAHTDPNDPQGYPRSAPEVCSSSSTHSQAMWRPWS